MEPQINPTPSNKAHKILLGIITFVVVILLFLCLWLIRQNRRLVNNGALNSDTNTVNTDVRVNSTVNSAVNNTTASNNATNTSDKSNSVTPGSTESGAPVLVSSTPAAGSNPAKDSVASVSVTFDRALDTSSTLSVTKVTVPQHAATGPTTFSNDKKTMTLSVNASSQVEYTVHYTACTGTNIGCTTGSLTFTVGTGGKVPSASKMESNQ